MKGLKNTGQFLRLATEMFEGALAQPADRYRSWMLEMVSAAFAADGAIWRRGQLGAPAHALTVWNLTPQFARAWESSTDINPLKLHMQAHPDSASGLALSTQPDALEQTRVYRRVLRQHGVRDAIGIRVVDPVLALETEIILSRSSRHTFASEDAERLEQVAPAMVAAASQAYFLSLARPSAALADRPSAVVDPAGGVLEAQWGFRRLLQRHYPKWTGRRLPFELPDDLNKASISVDGLRVYAEHLNELTLLRIWEPERLDGLTAREREIAEQLAAGTTYKQMARDLGLSTSTVANHAHRIYRKLGVKNRRELTAELHQSESAARGVT